MVEVTVLDGRKVLIRRLNQETPKETHTVSVVELWRDKTFVGTIWDALLYVKQVKIEEVKAPDGIYEKFAILTI